MQIIKQGIKELLHMKKENDYEGLTLGEASEKFEREIDKREIQFLKFQLKHKEAQLDTAKITIAYLEALLNVKLEASQKKESSTNWWFPFMNKQ